MDANEDCGNAFVIPDLYKTSNFFRPPAELDHELVNLDVNDSGTSAVPIVIIMTNNLRALCLEFFGDHKASTAFLEKQLEPRLPELLNLEYGPIDDVEPLEESSVSSLESLEIPESAEEDIWLHVGSEDRDGRGDQAVYSWEKFYDGQLQEPRSTYVSEGGSKLFDALLATANKEDGDQGELNTSSGIVIKPEPILSSLVQLAMGRDSIFYRFDEDSKTFKLRKDGIRMTGYSLEVFNSLSLELMEHAARVRYLKSLVTSIRGAFNKMTSLVALASEIWLILASLEDEIGQSLTSVRTLLEVKSLVEHPRQVVSCLQEMVDLAAGATSEQDILSKLFGFAKVRERFSPQLSKLVWSMFSSISRSWLESLHYSLGLKMSSSSLPASVWESSLLIIPQSPEAIATISDAKDMPSFVESEDARLIIETQESLQLVRTHQPNHPVVKLPANLYQGMNSVSWSSSWQDIESICTKAREYERSIMHAVEEYSNGTEVKGTPNAPVRIELSVQPWNLDASANTVTKTPIELLESPLKGLFFVNGSHAPPVNPEDRFEPPTSMLFGASFMPLVAAQARLASNACLRLLFKDHKLRSHLDLLNRFSLLTDGPFASRLSHALFDPSNGTSGGENHNYCGKPGLRLGSRITWPPASSELRLALMGILADSYFHEKPQRVSSVFREELPGGMSFAVREMSEEELGRCLKSDSIEALDFLKLQYSAEAPLDTIITEKALDRYDSVFKVLLRALRMQYVVSTLPRAVGDRKGRRMGNVMAIFRLESHHFVSSLSNYLFTGVKTHWLELHTKLAAVEASMEDGWSGGESLQELRDCHERTLDRIMTTLLLRKRQAEVLALVEEIFTMILQFARLVTPSDGLDGRSEDDSVEAMSELHGKFRKKVRTFVQTCRGLSEQVGLGGTQASDDHEADERGSNATGQLLLMFEMNDYYMR